MEELEVAINKEAGTLILHTLMSAHDPADAAGNTSLESVHYSGDSKMYQLNLWLPTLKL